MKWILVFLMTACLQAQAATEAPATELSVEMPAQTASGSASSEAGDGVVTQPVEVSEPQLVVNDVSDAGAAPSSSPIKNLKETEIPVQLEATKKAASHESPFIRIFLSLGIISILGAGAFFFLRKYRFSNDKKSQAAQIKVLTQHYLGPKKSLAIVRVAGESVLIGITDHNISMIKSLSLLDEDMPEEIPKEFQTVFAKKVKSDGSSEESSENKDDFSISGIKDFVTLKLKNMRSLE